MLSAGCGGDCVPSTHLTQTWPSDDQKPQWSNRNPCAHSELQTLEDPSLVLVSLGSNHRHELRPQHRPEAVLRIHAR